MRKKPSLRRQIVASIAFQTAFLLTLVLMMTVYFASWATRQEVDANRDVAIEALSTFAKSQLYYFDYDALRGSIASAVQSSMFDGIKLTDRYDVLLIEETKPGASTSGEPDHSIAIYHGDETLLGTLQFWNAPVDFHLGSISGIWLLNLLIVSLVFLISVMRSRRKIEDVIMAPINKFLFSMKHEPSAIVADSFESEEFSVLANGFHELHVALENAASRDSLTGLLNRRELDLALVREIEIAEREEQKLSLLFMDADKFKLINDTFGHNIGDEFLRNVTKRLRALESSDVSIFRFGGDEFVLLVRNCGKLCALTFAERIHNLFVRPVSVLNTQHETTFSIGTVTYPDDAKTASLLLARADMAVYDAKRSGRRRTIAYDAEFDLAYQKEALYERSLRKALKSKSIFFHKQPIARVSDLSLWAREALIRIPCLEEGKFVPPDQAINIASQSGYLGDLTDLTLAMARGHEVSGNVPECLCINFSAEQLIDASTFKKFSDLASVLNERIRQIVLEVTEDRLIEKPELIDLLHDLSKLGYRISLDDFGTAYSALACVRLLPLEIIKIDKSLLWGAMEDERDQRLFEAAISIARTFDCKVVVEGVETPQQLEYISNLGVEFAQGYYIDDLLARPTNTETKTLSKLAAGG